MLDKLLGLIAPVTCVGCGIEGFVLCERCELLFFEQLLPHCAGCKRLSDTNEVCKKCRSWLPLGNIHVVSRYEDASEHLVRAMKFDCMQASAKDIARLVAKQIDHTYDKWLLCPVATAPARIRERGFDHTRLLSKQLAELTGLDMEPCLQRRTNYRQVGSSRKERIEHMRDEFFCNKSLLGKNILLLDDVMTTGATLSGAAHVLRKAGAKRIDAVVFAQKY